MTDITSSTTIVGFTLVDITNTGVIRDLGGNELERNQQRNWETILQCIGLRAQPMDMAVAAPTLSSMKHHEFGELYTGEHKVWAFKFRVEHPGVWEVNGDQFALLDESFDEVPVITYLTETAKFMLPIFHTSGAIKNIYFKIADFELNT